MGLGWLQHKTQEVVTTSILRRICELFATLLCLDPRNVSSTNAQYLFKLTMPCWLDDNMPVAQPILETINLQVTQDVVFPQEVLVRNHRSIIF